MTRARLVINMIERLDQPIVNVFYGTLRCANDGSSTKRGHASPGALDSSPLCDYFSLLDCSYPACSRLLTGTSLVFGSLRWIDVHIDH